MRMILLPGQTLNRIMFYIENSEVIISFVCFSTSFLIIVFSIQ